MFFKLLLFFMIFFMLLSYFYVDPDNYIISGDTIVQHYKKNDHYDRSFYA